MLKIEKLSLNNKSKKILDDYQIYLITIKHMDKNTSVSSYVTDIYKYLTYQEKNNISNPLKIKYNDIIKYLKYLDDNNLAKTSIARKIVAIKSFHNYLSETYNINNESSKIKSFKEYRKLPNILTIEEVDNLLNIKLDTPFDYRNKAMLELMYSSGLRVSELVSLKLQDIDLDNSYVRCFGKGSKERIVPIGEYANNYLKIYIQDY